jgi:phosphoserine phosphatase
MQKRNKIYIFDVCGTLTKTNNTYHFIYWICKRNIIKLVLFYLYILGLDIFGFLKIKNQFFRYKLISLLSGYSKRDLEKYADDYINRLFDTKKVNDFLLKKIERLKTEGKRVILMSASIDLPINSLRKRLSIEAYSSSLIYMRGVCTGSLKEDLLFLKKDKLNEILKIGDSVYFYSDNYEDRDIFLDKNTNSNIIYHNKKELDYWNKKVTKANFLYFNLNSSSDVLNESLIRNNNLFYIPTFYYFLSRPQSCLSILIKELLPLILILFFYNRSFAIFTLVNLLVIYLFFFSLYEIGSFCNDYYAAKREKKPTLRIPKNVIINPYVFIFIRLLFCFFLVLIFKIDLYTILLSFFSLLLLIVHSFVIREKRFLTFLGLVIFRCLIPALFLFKNSYFFVFLYLLSSHLWRAFLYIAKTIDFGDKNKLFLVYLVTAFFLFVIFVSNKQFLFVFLSMFLVILNYYIFIQLRFKI